MDGYVDVFEVAGGDVFGDEGDLSAARGVVIGAVLVALDISADHGLFDYVLVESGFFYFGYILPVA